MRALRRLLDRQARHFEPGGKLHKFHALYEMPDTILFSPGTVTRGTTHVRDALDLKRMMMTVVLALVPAILMALYNTGLQAHRAITAGALPLDNWQTSAMRGLGLAFDPADIVACVVHGGLYFLPILAVTFAAGGAAESLFAIVREHEINEGFLVTGVLLPLTLPPTTPLWQVALGVLFGVIIGKEVFGGTGMNILNPALTARAFLFFAYPAEMSGDDVWIAAQTSPDGFSGATWLSRAAVDGAAGLEAGLAWRDAFLGFIPGSMGETSAVACLIGALILVLTGIGSWRIMVGLVAGTFATTWLLNIVGSETNLLMTVPFHWQIVLGGWAFGAVFMATEPVSAAHTNRGRWIYGFGVGLMAILVRVLNPAYPEGMMLAILFMNVFASTIDHFVVRANVRRRQARYAS